MARRAVAESEDSDSEHEEKPQITSNQQEVESESEEDDELAAGSQPQDPQPRKRRKLAHGAATSQQQQEDGSEAGAAGSDDEVQEADIKPFVVPKRIRDKDGFQEGAVFRVKCHNFLTYSDVEVFPGPYLNMILGPNGSGKSTIVSAISIALGTKAKTLKRHEKVSGMIKYGNTEGFVEVELKGKPGKRNTVIRREINAENDKSVWKLNGTKSTEEDVREAVAELNVQTDNLVCYLPQELVYEFAKMSGPQLLRATERSAGPAELPLWHDELIATKQKWITNEANIATDREQLSREEGLQARSRREEERLREREAVEKEFSFLSVLLPYHVYYERKGEHDRLKLADREIKTRLTQLKRELAPYTANQTAQVEKAKQLKDQVKKLETALGSIETKRRQKRDQARGLTANGERIRDEIENLNSAEKQRLDSIKKSKDIIRKHEETLGQGKPEEIDLTVEDAALEQANTNLQQFKGEYQRFQDQQKGLLDQQTGLEREQQEKERNLQRLQDSTRQRTEKLRHQDDKLYRAVQWINSNRQTFKGKVYDPVLLAVVPKKKEYAKFLDACIRETSSKTILVENSDDYDRISLALNNKQNEGGMNLRVSLGMIGDIGSLDAFQKPLPDEQLKAMGFDMWALDMAEGPEEVMRFLCQSANLHRTPVSINANKAIDENALQKTSAPFRRYIANGLSTTFNFSNYGRREAYSSSIALKLDNNDKILFSSGVDPQRVQEAKRELDVAVDNIGRLRGDLEATSEKDRELRQKAEDLKNHKNACNEARRAKQYKLREFEMAKTSLKSEQKVLDRLMKAPTQAERRKELLHKLRDSGHKRLAAVQAMQAVTFQAQETALQKATADLAWIHADANVTALKAEHAERNSAYNEALAEAGEAKARLTSAHQAATTSLKEFQDKMADYDGEFHVERASWLDEHPDLTTDDVETLHAEKEAQLMAAPEISPEVIRQVKQREASINKLRSDLQKKEKSHAKLEREWEALQKKYVPTVESIIKEIDDKFSAAFDAMGCMGQVELDNKDEDPQKWAIRIMVSFRQGTELVELSGQRQSGGERSLTTIMYFISLTKVSTAPFSLVDEINQGMDARNERAILRLLVQCTCDEDASQYFLITPKLLPNLTYHDKMKVMCIMNGDWLPEDGFSPRDWLRKAKAGLTQG